ncbi:type II toxin-antitoxin system RelE/ParE family toxin [Rubinisphaera margarita]|uniref:type II toxin-antitoxin system RelE/ParE family toxin n=1 Tax=Rubinisphaera margarita TaxID=2909586 RepID=UPI0036F1E7A8
MKFRVKTLPRADADILRIARYIHDRSPRGAEAWLVALEKALARLKQDPLASSEAMENDQFEIEIRQQLFKTRRGLVYRLIYTVVGHEVRVLRVRGSGQAPVEPHDVDPPLDSK